MTIGERIKQLRTAKNMTQEELGEKVGVKKAAIYKYETGLVVNLKRDVIENLAKALDTSPSYLMGLEDSDLPDTSEKKQRPIRSLARLEENDLTEAEDEQVSDFISFLLSKRDKKKDI